MRFDHKGKYYTDVRTKIPTRARIQTRQQLIIGNIHVQPDHRFLDEINQADEFVAVTDATVNQAEQSFQASFLAINKQHILWICPLEEDNNVVDSGSDLA